MGCALEVKLQEIFCRWAHVADELSPSDAESRLSKAVPLPQQVSLVAPLLNRVTDSVPADDAGLKMVVRSLLLQCQFRMKHDPEILSFLKRLLGESAAVGHADGADARVHDRIASCMKELVPSMWTLRSQLMPEEYASELPQLQGLKKAEDVGEPWFEKCIQPSDPAPAPAPGNDIINPVPSPCR